MMANYNKQSTVKRGRGWERNIDIDILRKRDLLDLTGREERNGI
jgi:hypothetical protein